MILEMYLHQSIQSLKNAQVAMSRTVVEEVLSYVMNIKRNRLIIENQRRVSYFQKRKCDLFFEKIKKGIPLSHLVPVVHFYSVPISVTADVLIPRPETELLVDRMVQKLKGCDLSGKKLLDLCCGSGCLGLALKKQFPELEVTLVDISEKALLVAKKNAHKNSLDVDVIQSDLLSDVDEKFDIIVCNPPYLSKKEYATLDKSVKDHEPELALVGGCNGTEIYSKLATALPSYLNKGAKLFFEIGYTQGHSIMNIFSASHWKNLSLEKDLSGLDRFFFVEKA